MFNFICLAVNMVNGISVNGLGEVSMDSQTNPNLIGLGKHIIYMAKVITNYKVKTCVKVYIYI